jgi:hypothetical protein
MIPVCRTEARGGPKSPKSRSRNDGSQLGEKRALLEKAWLPACLCDPGLPGQASQTSQAQRLRLL